MGAEPLPAFSTRFASLMSTEGEPSMMAVVKRTGHQDLVIQEWEW